MGNPALETAPSAPPQVGAAQPFASFFQREELRAERKRFHRRIIVASVALHVLIFGALAAWSLFNVEDLFGPSVDVKMYKALPSGAKQGPDRARRP